MRFAFTIDPRARSRSSVSRRKLVVRAQMPTYGACERLRLHPDEALDHRLGREPLALEQQLPCKRRSVQLAEREDALGHAPTLPTPWKNGAVHRSVSRVSCANSVTTAGGGPLGSVGRRNSLRRPTPFRLRGSLALQLLQLRLAAVVLCELLLEPLAEHAEGRDQRVELVQRVGARAPSTPRTRARSCGCSQ